jgi:hypothetical protein
MLTPRGEIDKTDDIRPRDIPIHLGRSSIYMVVSNETEGETAQYKAVVA